MGELRSVLQVTPIPPGPETLQAVKGAQMRIRKFVEEVDIDYVKKKLSSIVYLLILHTLSPLSEQNKFLSLSFACNLYALVQLVEL